ncbi:hypothetical protein LCGC14_1777070, partial [marine sediment metagenome]
AQRRTDKTGTRVTMTELIGEAIDQYRARCESEEEPVGAGETRLYTETRIRALGPRARLWFRLYWLITRPFSGLLRRAMLSGIKARAIAYNALISEQPERSV